MRIAIVSDAIMPYNMGGKEQRIAQMSQRLSKAGHDVHIYTMKWWDGPKVIEENGVWLHGIMKKRPLYKGERRSISEGVCFGLASLKLIKARFDLVDVDHMPYFPLYSMWLVCLIKRKPMFATWHEVWNKTYWQSYLGNTLGTIAYIIEKTSGLLPGKIIAVSPLTAERLHSVYGLDQRKIILAPNGVDIATITDIPKATQQSSDVIFVGRLLKNKNVAMLIEALAIAREDMPKIRCIIIGDGPEKAKLKKMTAALDLTDNITFLPFQKDHTDVLAHIKASKIFVLPSMREGFGIVAVEANACGLPVLTLDHPDNATTHLINDDNGATFQTTEELAALLKQYLASSHRIDRIIAAAHNYDWQLSVQKVMEGYTQ